MERPLRVLLVEDDPNDAELVARKLRAGGFTFSSQRVDRFEDLRAALADGAWDLVLSDHSMPGFRSSDVLTLLRQLPEQPPLVIVSGAIGEQEVVEALHLGAASYVDKNGLSRLAPTIERVLADAALRREHAATLERLQLVQAAVESTDHLIFVLEARAGAPPTVIYANEAAQRLTGYSASELVERGFVGLHKHDTDPLAVKRLLSAMTRGTAVSSELLLQHANGTTRWVETAIRPIAAGSHRYVAVSRDITERKQFEAQMSFLARHDPLTGLANRALLDERLDYEFAKAKRSQMPFAVLIVDVDKFKSVNDTFGHAAGDELLRTFGKRLHDCVREIDTVARLGGDEFVIILTSLISERYAGEVAQRIVTDLRTPVTIEGHDHKVSASVGIAVATAADDKKSLLRNADLALYRVKERGRDGYAF